ncbi:type II toxin-antitoxin system HicB family antitoxin [Mariniphaga sp.]|uniref:type II toxin-antitoxin system HicB family antitoxin n=1 Tax=Mariniphaga sp. TaxID=1954475 RepID=UPI003562B07F
MRLTMVIKQGKSGYLVGQLKEIPEVFTQGKDMKELKENILDALELYFEDIREQYNPMGDMIAEEELNFV